MMCRVLTLLVLVAVCLILNDAREAPKAGEGAVNKDLPYIACDTCKVLVSELHRQVTAEKGLVKDVQREGDFLKRTRKLDEDRVSDILDSMCIPENDEGSWIRSLDIVEKKADKEGQRIELKLEAHDSKRKCGFECNTIGLSCHRLLEEEIDRDELQELMYLSKASVESHVEKVCNKMSKRCKKMKTYNPETYAREDEEFVGMVSLVLKFSTLLASFVMWSGALDSSDIL